MDTQSCPHCAAAIVLYHPCENILSNIDSYASAVKKIYAIDNTESPNQALANRLKERYKNLEYIPNNQNLGIATALNQACDMAIDDGFAWLLTMDQDSCFINFNDYLACLEKHGEISKTALLAPNPQWHAKEHLPKNPLFNYEEKSLVITSGNFLNLTLFNKIGRFEEKLFIDMVDYDYCLKARMLDYKILYFPDIMLQHSLGNLFQRKNLVTRKLRNKIEHSPQRVYYGARNFLYLSKKYSKAFPREFSLPKILNILFIHEITKILIYEDQKLAKINAKFLGLWHFIIGKYGKHEL
jgi:rhamnosyltransferase